MPLPRYAGGSRHSRRYASYCPAPGVGRGLGPHERRGSGCGSAGRRRGCRRRACSSGRARGRRWWPRCAPRCSPPARRPSGGRRGAFSAARCRRQQRPMTVPALMARAANSEAVPWRGWSCGRRSVRPGRSGRSGRVRSSAWTPVLPSAPSAKARSGGLRQSPPVSRTPPTGAGSAESLEASLRCGRRPKARQTRPTVGAQTPASPATAGSVRPAAPRRTLRARRASLAPQPGCPDPRPTSRAGH